MTVPRRQIQQFSQVAISKSAQVFQRQDLPVLGIQQEQRPPGIPAVLLRAGRRFPEGRLLGGRPPSRTIRLLEATVPDQHVENHG
jgi:hypothetical protein